MTVCNQNRIHCTKLNESIANCSQEGVTHDCDILNKIKTFACDQRQLDDTEEDDADEQEVPSSVDIENNFLYNFMDLGETMRLTIGHQREDMIKFCAFKGKICPEGLVFALIHR